MLLRNLLVFYQEHFPGRSNIVKKNPQFVSRISSFLDSSTLQVQFSDVKFDHVGSRDSDTIQMLYIF